LSRVIVWSVHDTLELVRLSGVLEIDALHRASVSHSVFSLSSIPFLVLVISSLPFLVALLVISSLTFLVAQLVIIGSCLLVYSYSWCLMYRRLSSLFGWPYISVIVR
jgi:hypothetical protein